MEKSKLIGVGLKDEYKDLQLVELQLEDEIDSIYVWGKRVDFVPLIGEELEYFSYPSSWKGEPLDMCGYTNAVIKVLDVSGYKYNGTFLMGSTSDNYRALNYDESSLIEGITTEEATALLKHLSTGESLKAAWIDLQVIGKNGKDFSVRLFIDKSLMETNLSVLRGFINTLVVLEKIEKTKYGVNVGGVSSKGLDGETSDDVRISKEFVKDAFISDKEVMNILLESKLLSSLENRVTNYKGAELIKLAASLICLENLNGIRSVVQKDNIKRALLFDKFKVGSPDSILTPDIFFYKAMMTYKIDNRYKEEISILLGTSLNKQSLSVFNMCKEIAESAINNYVEV